MIEKPRTGAMKKRESSSSGGCYLPSGKAEVPEQQGRGLQVEAEIEECLTGTSTAKDDARSRETGRGMPGFSLPSALHSSVTCCHWPIQLEVSLVMHLVEGSLPVMQGRAGKAMKGSADEQACGHTALWEEVGGRKKN